MVLETKLDDIPNTNKNGFSRFVLFILVEPRAPYLTQKGGFLGILAQKKEDCSIWENADA